MLFFLREAKLRTGKGGATLYFVLGQVTVILLAAYNVPLLWEFLHGEATVTEVLYAMLSVAFIIYIFTRIFSLEVKPKEEAPAPAAEEA
jgi:membrane protein implicated in regulation of membrane protease activity